MIISFGRRYIFVHAPKTGGTSLSLALEARAMKDDILIGDTPKAKRRRKRLNALNPAGRLWKHSTLADIDGIVTAADLADLYLVTLVRNPWDRMVSYYHWLQDQSFDHPAVGLAQSLEFEPFVTHEQTINSFRSSNYGSYMRDAHGVEQDAHYIRIEYLDEDLGPFEEHLGFSLSDIPRCNRSSRNSDYRAYYSEHSQSVVAKLCSQDIRRFGYSF